jgi:hypothetical protein
MVGWARAQKIAGLLLEAIKVAAKPKKLSRKQRNDVLMCEPAEIADEQQPPSSCYLRNCRLTISITAATMTTN